MSDKTREAITKRLERKAKAAEKAQPKPKAEPKQDDDAKGQAGA